MLVLRLGVGSPRSLLCPGSDAHLMELHHGGIGTDSWPGPLCPDPDQVLLIWLFLCLTWIFVVLEKTPDSLASDDVVSDTWVHLLVGGHHVGDPARPTKIGWEFLHYSSSQPRSRFTECLQLLWVGLQVVHGGLSLRLWTRFTWFVLIFLGFNCDGDFFVFCDHFAPVLIKLTKGIGDFVVLVLDDEALLLAGVVLVIINEVILDLE